MKRGLVGLLAVALVHPAAANTVLVPPGGSIRAALERAASGDVILVPPGTYHEGSPGDLNALTVTQDGIHLVGLSSPTRPVVLANAGTQRFGIWVSPADSTGLAAEADDEHPPCGTSGAVLNGFSLSGFTVTGFAQHGVHLACVDGFELTRNVADGNGFYGLFPVVSRNGAIFDNEVKNTFSDAAIYVGQSDNVSIAQNFAHHSLIGIEVENSRNCTVVGNHASGNTVGIIVDILPGLLRTTQQSTLVAFNAVSDNNRPNTGQPGDIISAIPAGTGILLVGADTTTVTGNEISGNGFTGIGVASLCTGLALLGQPCVNLGIDPDADGNRIIGNRLSGNGTVPSRLPILSADLVWDGTGLGNCWSDNRFSTSFPPALPPCR